MNPEKPLTEGYQPKIEGKTYDFGFQPQEIRGFQPEQDNSSIPKPANMQPSAQPSKTEKK